MQTPAFGGIIKNPDPRDYDLHAINQSLGGSSIVSKKSNNDYSMIPYDFQGQQPACSMHAFARLKSILHYRRTGQVKHFSPRLGWKYVKEIDGYPLDAGTDINSIFKVGRTKSTCDFSLTGNDVSLSLQDYVNLNVTPEMTADASNELTEAEAFIYGPTWEQICQTIDLHGACIILMRVGPNMYTPDWNHNQPLDPDKFPLDSGHFMVCENYDENFIYVGNEWGTTWGKGGEGWFDRRYISHVNAIATCVDKAIIPTQAIPANLQNVINHSPSWTQKQIQVFLDLCRKYGLIK